MLYNSNEMMSLFFEFVTQYPAAKKIGIIQQVFEYLYQFVILRYLFKNKKTITTGYF